MHAYSRGPLLCAVLAVLGSSAAGAWPGPSGEAEDIVFHGTAGVQLVLVPVSVTAGGKHVPDLPADSFQLRVDGIRVPIELFESDSRTPVSFVLLQDLSGSMANSGKIELARRASRFFVDRAIGSDELAIVTFAGGRTTVDMPFTTNREVAREQIEAWEPWGTTTLYDAISWLPEIGLDGRHNRRAAILVTDGADNASVLDPAEVTALVERARVPVYVLDLGGARATAPGPDGEETRRFGHVLRELALATDGGYHPIESEADLQRACTTIERDLANQYVLGFETGDRGFETPHRLTVSVAVPKGKRALAVEHRPGYHGFRPAAMSRTPSAP